MGAGAGVDVGAGGSEGLGSGVVHKGKGICHTDIDKNADEDISTVRY